MMRRFLRLNNRHETRNDTNVVDRNIDESVSANRIQQKVNNTTNKGSISQRNENNSEIDDSLHDDKGTIGRGRSNTNLLHKSYKFCKKIIIKKKKNRVDESIITVTKALSLSPTSVVSHHEGVSSSFIHRRNDDNSNQFDTNTENIIREQRSEAHDDSNISTLTTNFREDHPADSIGINSGQVHNSGLDPDGVINGVAQDTSTNEVVQSHANQIFCDPDRPLIQEVGDGNSNSYGIVYDTAQDPVAAKNMVEDRPADEEDGQFRVFEIFKDRNNTSEHPNDGSIQQEVDDDDDSFDSNVVVISGVAQNYANMTLEHPDDASIQQDVDDDDGTFYSNIVVINGTHLIDEDQQIANNPSDISVVVETEDNVPSKNNVADFNRDLAPCFKDQTINVKYRRPRMARVIVTKDNIVPGMAIATEVNKDHVSLVRSSTPQPVQKERHVRSTEPEIANSHMISEVANSSTIEEAPISRRQRRFPRMFSRLWASHQDGMNRMDHNKERRQQCRRLSRSHQQRSSIGKIMPSSNIVDAWPMQEDVTSLLQQQSSRIDRLERFARKESSQKNFTSSLVQGIRIRNPLKRRIASYDKTRWSFDQRQWAVDHLAMLTELSIRTTSVACPEDVCSSSNIALSTTTNNIRPTRSSIDPPGLICSDVFLNRNLVKAQGRIRTWLCQKQYNRWKQERERKFAALIIQNSWMRCTCKRSRLIEMKHEATRIILNAFNTNLGVLHDILLFHCFKYVWMNKQATVIQRTFRSALTRTNDSIVPVIEAVYSNISKDRILDESSIRSNQNKSLIHGKFLRAGADLVCQRLLVSDNSCKLSSHRNYEPELPSSVLNIVREMKKEKQPIILFDELFQRLDCCESHDSLFECLQQLAETGEIFYFGDNMAEMISKVIVLSKGWMSYLFRHVRRRDFFKGVESTKKYLCLEAEHTVPVLDDWTDLIHCNKLPVVSSHDVRLDWLSLKHIRKALSPFFNDDPVQNRNIQLVLFDFLESLMIKKGIFVDCSVAGQCSSRTSNISEEISAKTIFFLPDHLEFSDAASSWFHNAAWYRPFYSWQTTIFLSWSFSQPYSNVFWGQILARIVGRFMEKSMIVDDMKCWRDAVAIESGSTEIFLRFENIRGCTKILSCGRGADDFSGRNIWNEGGFQTIVDAINSELCKLEVEKHIICPACLEHGTLDNASAMKYDYVVSAAHRHRSFLLCNKGHRVDTQLLSGCFFRNVNDLHPTSSCLCMALASLRPAIVQVLVWDDVSKRVTSLGSGFIVDAKRGLVITAAHVIYHMNNTDGQFGKFRGTRTFIGTITDKNVASFRYFAVPVAQDVQNVDACILRIRTRLKNHVTSIDDLASMQDVGYPLDVDDAMSNENLQSLTMTDRFMMEEHVRVLGFNQREDAVKDGIDDIKEGYRRIFRSIDVVKGYVCRYFEKCDCIPLERSSLAMKLEFSARKELVIDCCRTLNGDSGGPCVNSEGKVLGILSRGRGNRSFVVPTCEIEQLVNSCTL